MSISNLISTAKVDAGRSYAEINMSADARQGVSYMTVTSNEVPVGLLTQKPVAMPKPLGRILPRGLIHQPSLPYDLCTEEIKAISDRRNAKWANEHAAKQIPETERRGLFHIEPLTEESQRNAAYNLDNSKQIAQRIADHELRTRRFLGMGEGVAKNAEYRKGPVENQTTLKRDVRFSKQRDYDIQRAKQEAARANISLARSVRDNGGKTQQRDFNKTQQVSVFGYLKKLIVNSPTLNTTRVQNKIHKDTDASPTRNLRYDQQTGHQRIQNHINNVDGSVVMLGRNARCTVTASVDKGIMRIETSTLRNNKTTVSLENIPVVDMPKRFQPFLKGGRVMLNQHKDILPAVCTVIRNKAPQPMLNMDRGGRHTQQNTYDTHLDVNPRFIAKDAERSVHVPKQEAASVDIQPSFRYNLKNVDNRWSTDMRGAFL